LDDAILSLGKLDRTTSVSITLFDLIPLVNPEQFLSADPGYSSFYNSKLESIKQAKLLLAISKYTKQEALDKLKIQNDRVINISTGINHDLFKDKDTDNSQDVLCKLGIKNHFIFTAGSEEIHKNLKRMVKSFAALPPRLRLDVSLVIGGKFSSGFISELKQWAMRWGLSEDSLCFPDFIQDNDLICLYRHCKFFIFPSCHEGFGLPVLEAMACGTPVICSNITSLPEVIGLPEATFNPFDVTSISAKMMQVLNNNAFRQKLKEHGIKQAQKFSWDKTAKKTFEAWGKIMPDKAPIQMV
jgi:glycosyltransferase involved in cell wall biosynthesis